MSERKDKINKNSKHVHVGYLGPKKLFPEEIYLAILSNRQAGVVNHHFIYRRDSGDNCEMDVINRLYPESLHQITERQYRDIVIRGKLKEV